MPVEEIESRPPAPLSTTSSDVATTGHGRSHGLYWPQNHELAESTIPDLLSVVSRNALIVIPAERCVMFMYDKSTNYLTAQVSCGGRVITDGAERPTLHAENEESEDEDELSFHPVMGLVSACFLQRRCLRMQEPNLHKSFYREYDVPARMVMNSIIVAPVTLHHRTVGVIELVNRIDPDAPEASLDNHVASAAAEGSGKGNEENEVKLMRTTVVQQKARAGFSAKDEQKMIQFTSHVAQLLDNKLRLLAQVESAAKFREEQAKSAMELLEMMNQKLEYRSTIVPVDDESPTPRLVKRRSSIHAAPVEWTREELVKHAQDEPQHKGLDLCDVDMLKVMIGISRTQAIFRGHHLRKVHRLSEALHEHRMVRRRIKSALVIQRATRQFLARRWRKKRRNAVWVIVRAIKSYQMRVAVAQRLEVKKRQKRKQPVVIEAKPREGAHHTLVERDVHKVRERYASAIRIQQQFRGHKARKQIEKIVGFKNLTKGLKNIVKLQSMLRGTMARKHVAKIREEKRAARAAKVVCMRLAVTDSDLGNGTVNTQPPVHQVLSSRDCLYRLPALPNGAAVAASRIGPSCIHDQLHAHNLRLDADAPSPARDFRRGRLVRPATKSTASDIGGVDNGSWISPLSRPLAPSPSASPRFVVERLTPIIPPDDTRVRRAELARLHPEVVFELDAKRARRCPQGVQRADEWLPPRARHHAKSTRRTRILDEREAEDPANRTPRDSGRQSFRKQTSSGLHRLVDPFPPLRSNQLQVCFLPAGNTPRSTTRPSYDERASASLPTQPKTSRTLLPSPPRPRRALTTG